MNDVLAAQLSRLADAVKGDKTPLDSCYSQDVVDFLRQAALSPQAPATATCEDCDGRGGDGEAHYMGDFQPPEQEPCKSCGGSGLVRIDHQAPAGAVDKP